MILKHRYEFKNNHEEWVRAVQPDLGPGIRERVWEALGETDEKIDACQYLKTEFRSALTDLLGVIFLSLSQKSHKQLYIFPWIHFFLHESLGLWCSCPANSSWSSTKTTNRPFYTRKFSCPGF